MNWLVLSLICAFALASSDAAAKHWMSRANAYELLLIRLGLSGLLLLPWAINVDLTSLPAAFWAWMALLMPLEILAMLLYVKAIRDYPLALTVPYLAFTPVLVALTGWLILDERLSNWGLFGVLLVVTGSWLLNLRQAPGWGAAQVLAPIAAIASNPGSRLMLGAALIYALTSVGGKAAMQWMPAAQFGPFYFAVLGLLTLVLVTLLRPQALRIHHYGTWPLLIVSGLMAVMVVTHFIALEQVEAAYMIAVKRSSLLFAILYGALLFGERQLGQHLLAGSIMLAGVAVIAV